MSGTASTKVLYIGGYSRSGSTLLLRLLGERPGVVAVGELFDVWERSYLQNQLCGCGAGFRDCAFWTQVTARAFGCAPGQVPAAQLHADRARVQGHRKIPLLWRPELRPPRYAGALAGYATVLDGLYAAVREVSGSEVIVDSSKVPQYAWVLAEAPGIELHVLHLVRDSRATAYSWQRHRLRPEITGQKAYMDTHSLARSACEWSLFNYLIRSRRRSYASYTLIKYEELVADPRAALRKVTQSVGCPPAPDGVPASLGLSHTASGNPGRFRVGEVGIRLDGEWMHAMTGRQRAIVTALTAAGLARYSYPWRAGRAGGALPSSVGP